MTKLIIRNIESDDVDAILELARSDYSFQVDSENVFWTKSQLLSWIKDKKDVLLVAEFDGKIISFFLSMHHRPTGKVVVENLFVAKKFRGSRPGRLDIAFNIFKEGLSQLKKQGAIFVVGEVLTNNIPIKRLLGRLEFEKGKDFCWFTRFL